MSDTPIPDWMDDDDEPAEQPRGTDSLEALLLTERLLGSALKSPTLMERMRIAGVTTADLEKVQHGDMWTAMVAVETKHGRVDTTLVSAHLRESLGWNVRDVAQWLTSAENAARGQMDDEDVVLALERIRYAAGIRRVRTVGAKLMDEAKDRKKAIADIVGDAERELESIVNSTTNQMRIKTGAMLAKSLSVRLASERKQPFIRIRTGIPEFDKAMRGGYRTGKPFVVGADFGVGKTTFMAHLAIAALEDGHEVHIKTFEASADEIFDVFVEMRAGRRIVDATTQADFSAIQEAQAFFASVPLFVEAVEALTVEELVSRAHAARSDMKTRGVDEETVGLVFMIDYFQDIERSTRHARDDLNFAHMSKALRRGFERYNIAGVEFSQLSEPKDPRAKQPNGPTDAQLAFTKQLGKDAAYVAILDRPKDHEDEAIANTTRCKLTKNRPDKFTCRTWMRYMTDSTRLMPSDSNGRISVVDAASRSLFRIPTTAQTTNIDIDVDDDPWPT